MFSKRKSRRSNPAEKITNRAADGIAQGIGRVQNAFGRSMNRCTRHFSARTWKILLVLSAAGWTLLCLYFFSSSPANSIGTQHLPVLMTRPAGHDSLRLLENVYEQRIIKSRDNPSGDTFKKK